MEYVTIGFFLAIGWFSIKLVYEMATELIFTRLHKAKWYQIAAGKIPAETNDQPGDIKAVKNQIGFR